MASPVKIRVRGVHETQRNLAQVGFRAMHPAPALRTAEDEVRDTLHHGAWHDRTGVLARSLNSAATRVLTSDTGVTVVNTVPYAPFVFGGTRRRRGTPPIVNKGALVDVVRDTVTPFITR